MVRLVATVGYSLLQVALLVAGQQQMATISLLHGLSSCLLVLYVQIQLRVVAVGVNLPRADRTAV